MRPRCEQPCPGQVVLDYIFVYLETMTGIVRHTLQTISVEQIQCHIVFSPVADCMGMTFDSLGALCYSKLNAKPCGSLLARG